MKFVSVFFKGLVGMGIVSAVLVGIIYAVLSLPVWSIFLIFDEELHIILRLLLVPGAIFWVAFFITGMAEIGDDFLRDMKRPK